jgi:hypothetical protein
MLMNCSGRGPVIIPDLRVQRKAIWWLLMKKRGEMSYVERLTQLNLVPLVYDREQKDLSFTVVL